MNFAVPLSNNTTIDSDFLRKIANCCQEDRETGYKFDPTNKDLCWLAIRRLRQKRRPNADSEIQAAYNVPAHSLFPKLCEIQELFFALQSDAFSSKFASPDGTTVYHYDVTVVVSFYLKDPESSTGKQGPVLHLDTLIATLFPKIKDPSDVNIRRDISTRIDAEARSWLAEHLDRYSIFDDVPLGFQPTV